jgi:hypothetical protein
MANINPFLNHRGRDTDQHLVQDVRRQDRPLRRLQGGGHQ